MVIEASFPEQVDDAAGRTGLSIRRAEYDLSDARMDDRANAHDARLQSDVERAAGQTVVAKPDRRIAQCHDFGMCGWVFSGDRLIVAPSDDCSVQDHHCADRDLVAGRRLMCQ